MSDEFDDAFDRVVATSDRRRRASIVDEPPNAIPNLVSEVYAQAAAPFRAKLLECLLRPVGPLALAAIAAGAFGGLLYRRGSNAATISIEDATRITSDQVLELTRFVEQCNPDALLQIGSMMADGPLGVASLSSSILLMALSAWRQRAANSRE